jgi:hypothetical protein
MSPWPLTASIALVLCVACGRPSETSSASPTLVPTTIVLTGGPGKTAPVFASTSFPELKALFLNTGPSSCPNPPADQVSCWPNASVPASSLYVILPSLGGFGSKPGLIATLIGSTLKLDQPLPSPAPAPPVMRSASVSELIAIPLRDLPAKPISVIAPPWDGSTWHGGAALEDLRYPSVEVANLSSLVSQLNAARNLAAGDASRRLAVGVAGFVVIDRVGVAVWNDDSLSCPGVLATVHTRVAGYIFFFVQGGVPTSPEIEYHVAGPRVVFCMRR